MKLRNGFSLLELLVAVMVASLLTGLLFFAYAQLQKGMLRFDIFIQRHSSIELLERVISRDLMGVCVPLTVLEQAQKKQKKNDDKKESNEKKKEVIQSVFVVKANQELTTSLTCISNNNLSSYVIEGITDLKPWLSRISYTLEKEAKGTYRLLRRQSHDLAVENKETAFPLAHDISSFSMTLVRFDKEEDGEITMVERAEWDSNNPEKNNDGLLYVPDLIVVKVSFAKKMIGAARSYSFVVPIFARPGLLVKQQPTEQPDKQKQTPAQQQQQADAQKQAPADKKSPLQNGIPEQPVGTTGQPGLPPQPQQNQGSPAPFNLNQFLSNELSQNKSSEKES